MTLPQGPDQFQPVHDRHAVIDDQAAVARQIGVDQQRLRSRIKPDREAFDLEGELERTADCGIVVDDKHGPRLFRHPASLWSGAVEEQGHL